MESPEAWGDAQVWGWGMLLSIILLFPPNPRTSLSLSQLSLFFRIPSPLPGSSTPCFPEIFPLSMDIQLFLPSSCLLGASGEVSKDRVAAVCFGLMTFRHFESCWIF